MNIEVYDTISKKSFHFENVTVDRGPEMNVVWEECDSCCNGKRNFVGYFPLHCIIINKRIPYSIT